MQVAGKIVYIKKDSKENFNNKINDASNEAFMELQKLDEALKNVETTLKNKIEFTEMAEAIRTVLKDEEILQSIRNKIIVEKENIIASVYQTSEEAVSLVENLEDAYLRERAVDIKAALSMLIDEVAGKEKLEISEPSIIIGEEILLTDVINLDVSKIVAIISGEGSDLSHLAIIAKSNEIPYIHGIEIKSLINAKRLIVDENKTFIINPSEEEFETVLINMENQKKRKASCEEDDASTESYEGPIELLANITNIRDVELVKKNKAMGIGLYRSEFMYLNRNSAPNEEEQFENYKFVLEEMAGKKVIIRTFDIGEDKAVNYLYLNKSRGIELALANKEIFRTQLRAILRAAVFGDARILYPMISNLFQIDQIEEQIKLAADELKNRGVEFRIPPQGIMIERVEAVEKSLDLAKRVEFFSIGTNDLMADIFELDRNVDIDMEKNGKVKYNHEIVLSYIRKTVENAHNSGIRVGICGELGSDCRVIPQFLEMGIDELSMAPVKLDSIRKFLNNIK